MRQGDRRRPGNVVLRRTRVHPEVLQVPRRRRLRFTPKLWMIPGAFALVIGLGTLLLSLPAASESRTWTDGWDALFTATSAVSVTGLVRFDTAEHWSGFGEIVILGLFQAGGLGVTMYAGAILLIVGQRFGLRGREFFGMEMMAVGEHDVRRLLRRVMLFTVIIELVAFLLLLPWFLDQAAEGRAVWKSLFHAVSAFNNAGFDLMGGRMSFTGQVESPYPIVVMGIAAFLGSLSFVTVFSLRRRPRRWRLDTRLVIIGMTALLLVGMVVFLAGEVQGGRVLDGLGVGDAVANSFFLSVNRITGMTTVDMGTIRDSTTVVLLALMFIGGASTSTAGGIKMGAFMVSLIAVLSSLRGRRGAEAFGREIPQVIVLRAGAVTVLGLATLLVGVWLVALTDDIPFLPLLFEVMSALANVGWSQGATPALSTAGAVILVVLMFVGRLGPLLVALSVPERPEARYQYPAEGVRIG